MFWNKIQTKNEEFYEKNGLLEGNQANVALILLIRASRTFE